MGRKEPGTVVKVLRHIPALFSIVMTCVMIYQGGVFQIVRREGLPYEVVETDYYTLNYLFVLGIFIYVILEHIFLDVKSYRFRRFSLWSSAFISLGIVSMPALALGFGFILITPLLALVLVVFSFIGKQPKIEEGRFYPVIFGLLSVLWIIVFLGSMA